VKLDSSQLAAVAHAVGSRFAIINGGAGTGKTTIIKQIADDLTGNREKVNLCAFAGKAAARVRDATKYPASTIHRMLDFRGDSVGFMLDSLRGVSVIVDEASMIDSALLSEIITRNPKRLVLVGDQAQLPPVGAGQPFHDLIELCPELVKTLTTCYRQTEAVFQAASTIRAGQVPPMHAESPGERWDVVAVKDADAAHAKVMDLVRSGDVDFTQDILLTCRNGDSGEESMPASVKRLNHDIKAMVNPNADGSTGKFRAGDRVINTKNNPALDIWNGTTGTVLFVDTAGTVQIKLDTKIIDHGRSLPRDIVYTDQVTLPKEWNKHLELAYALTVHKSQGSQYRKVWFLCLARDCVTLLDRPMIYTAVTRTQKQCTVIGELAAFRRAIGTVRTKRTVLQEINKAENGAK